LINISRENFVKNFFRFPKINLIYCLFILGFGEWLISDLFNFSGGTLGFLLLSVGGYFYIKNEEPKFNEPKDLNGWIKLCNDDLKYFEELEIKNNVFNKNYLRKNHLNEILKNIEKLNITFVGEINQSECKNILDKYIVDNKYSLNVINQLPSISNKKKSTDDLKKSDAIFYNINLPLTAKDLLWLKAFPEDMQIWLVIPLSKNISDNGLNELKEEVPENLRNKIMFINETKKQFNDVPSEFRKFIKNPKKNIENTQKRLLRELHSDWQAEIEIIRRMQLRDIQRKNQLLVAASVFASPVPSIDVLSMTVLNSLMIKEIKKIWGCNWSPEILEKLSKQIIKTAIAQGVVEWSGQTLLNISKFHGPNWILAGSIQAISAAYLTRVVSRSLADFMAINKGVSEPDLEFIKNNSYKIVENAFESEKINWKSLISEFQNPLKTKLS